MWGRVGKQTCGKVQTVFVSTKNHLAPQHFDHMLAPFFAIMLKLDPRRVKLVTGDGSEKRNQPLNKTLVEMPQAPDIIGGGIQQHIGVLACDEKVCISSVAQQTLIGLCTPQAFPKRRAT